MHLSNAYEYRNYEDIEPKEANRLRLQSVSTVSTGSIIPNHRFPFPFPEIVFCNPALDVGHNNNHVNTLTQPYTFHNVSCHAQHTTLRMNVTMKYLRCCWLCGLAREGR